MGEARGLPYAGQSIRAVLFQMMDNGVGAPHKYYGAGHHDVELDFYPQHQEVANVPDGHDDDIERYLGDRGDEVRHACREKCVVEVGLVGREGAFAVEDPHGHNPEGVENGHAEYCQGQRHHAAAVGIHERIGRGTAAEKVDAEPRHQDSKNHGAGIADEHAREVAENVVEEEGQQRAHHHEGQHGVAVIAHPIEGVSEETAAHYAEAAAEAVYSVYHIEGVDDAHAAYHGEHHAEIPAEAAHAPEAVERIHAEVGGEDDGEHGKYFQEEPLQGRESADIVDGAHVEHQRHRYQHGKYGREVHTQGQRQYGRGAAQPYEDSEHHGYASKNRHRHFLKLAGIRIIHKVFVFGNGQDLEIHHLHSHQGRQSQRYNE